MYFKLFVLIRMTYLDINVRRSVSPSLRVILKITDIEYTLNIFSFLNLSRADYKLA